MNGRIFLVINNDYFAEPMGVMQLSAVLKKHDYEVGFGINMREDVFGAIKEFKPDVVGFSSMTSDIKDLLPLIDRVKNELGIFTLLGGPHPTFFKEVINHPTLDAICVGEGEIAILDLLERLAQHGSIDNIKNIVTKTSGKLELNPLITDLDNLPFIDRDIVSNRKEFRVLKVLSFYTSRGCLYNCTYCFNSKYNKVYRGNKIFRRRSVDNIIEEIKIVRRNHPIQFIRFSDDTFLYKVDDWFLEFVEKYRKEVNIPFYFLLRADNVTEEMARLLKSAGCHSVGMSIESGNEEIRKNMLNRKISNEKLIKNFSIVKVAGINILSACIVALPYTRLEDEKKTIEIAIQSKCDNPGFCIFIPFPGTPLGERVKRDNMLSDGVNDLFSFSQYSTLNCFSKQEKQIRYNLMLLGTFCVIFPVFKNIILNHLIFFKPNKLFELIHFLSQGYCLSRKIFPVKYSLKEYIEVFKEYVREWLYSLKHNLKIPE